MISGNRLKQVERRAVRLGLCLDDQLIPIELPVAEINDPGMAAVMFAQKGLRNFRIELRKRGEQAVLEKAVSAVYPVLFHQLPIQLGRNFRRIDL